MAGTDPSPAYDNFQDKVAVLVEGRLELYWDRRIPLEPISKQAVVDLEQRLRLGFDVADIHYPHPDTLQCAQMAASLIPQALQSNRESAAGVALALVSQLMPKLKQIHYRQRPDGTFDIAFITDRSYMPNERTMRLH